MTVLRTVVCSRSSYRGQIRADPAFVEVDIVVDDCGALCEVMIAVVRIAVSRSCGSVST